MKIYKTALGYTIRGKDITVYADDNGAYDADSFMGPIKGDPVDINTLPKELAGDMLKAVFWRPPVCQ